MNMPHDDGYMERLFIELERSKHFRNLVKNRQKLQELVNILHTVAMGDDDEAFSSSSSSSSNQHALCSPPRRPPSQGTASEHVLKTTITPLDFFVDTSTFFDGPVHFYGYYSKGRPDDFVYIPQIETLENNVPVLDLSQGGYLTASLWSGGPLKDEHIEKNAATGEPLPLSDLDQALFLSHQYKTLKNGCEKSHFLQEFSKRFITSSLLTPLAVHQGVFLYRGDPRRRASSCVHIATP